MSEETITNQEQKVDTITQNLQNAMWGEEGQQQQQNSQEQNQQQDNQQQQSQEQNNDQHQEIAVPVEWLKKEFDIEDYTVLKAEREELKTLKANPPKVEEIKFDDDQSKHIYELLREGGDKKKEVLKFLATQEKIEALVSSEVTKENAADIVKFGMQLKSKASGSELTDFEINRLFNRKFQMPEKPTLEDVKSDSTILESDEEKVYQERLSKWQSQVEEVNLDISIEAKQLKPDLEKAKAELVLPEINKGVQAKQEPTPEEQEAFNKSKDSFKQSAKQTIDGFGGFTAQVKDKDVDYTVGYTPSPDEKTLVSTKLNEFAESGFDANALFVDRWLMEDGKTMNIQQMTEDLSRIFMGKNSDEKLAVDAANKRIEAFLREKRNPNVMEGNQNRTFQPNGTQTPSEKLADMFFA
ncbi:MAG: hypothetical protein V4538_15215 [Bacteroidota bacterium]